MTAARGTTPDEAQRAWWREAGIAMRLLSGRWTFLLADAQPSARVRGVALMARAEEAPA